MTSNGTMDKPFSIEKRRVYEAYKAVKSNRGAAGVDGQSLEQFDRDLKGNLYKIWNRMASGSYFPPPVRAVPIPKKTGGERILGVPAVGDRIATSATSGPDRAIGLELQKCVGGAGCGSAGAGCGNRSRGLDVAQTLLVAMRKYLVVVARPR